MTRKTYQGNVTSWAQWLKLKEQGYTDVAGHFSCSNNLLTSLVGSPQTVGGYFHCYNNLLTSLVGSPQTVGGYFHCYNNLLTSLEGSPQTVGGYFHCSYNQLTSLEGCPQTVGGNFDCSYNKLTSLVGSPQTVGGNFDCSNNQLTSLVGSPQTVGGNFDCSNNQLTSLEGAPVQNSNMFPAFYAQGYIFADGILTKLINERVKDGVTIYKTEKLGIAEIIYVAAKNNHYAHGKTIAEAILDLEFKTGERNIDEFKNMPLDTKKTPEEWGTIYRLITGACKEGIKMFMGSKGELKEEYTLKEIIRETKDAYNSNVFREVVAGEG